MQPGQIIANLLKQPISVTALTFRTGQLVYGKINKIFPNQTAEVRIGDTKLTAVIDAPLTAGKNYWFLVEADDGVTKLKMLEGKLTGNTVSDAGQALKLLSLAQTKESLQLSAFLLKNGIPITRDAVDNMLGWIKSSASFEQGMEVIKTMHIKNIPLTGQNYQAMNSIQSDVSFHSLLKGLAHQLNQLTDHTLASKQLKEMADFLTETVKEKSANQALVKIYGKWLKDLDQDGAAFQLLKEFGYVPERLNERQFISRLLTPEGLEKVQNTNLKQGAEMLLILLKALKNSDIHAIESLLNRIEGKMLPDVDRLKSTIESLKNVPAGTSPKNTPIFSPVQEVQLIKKWLATFFDSSLNSQRFSIEASKSANDIKTFLAAVTAQETANSNHKLGAYISGRMEGNTAAIPAALVNGDDGWLLNGQNAGPDFSEADQVKLYVKKMIKSLGLDHISIPMEHNKSADGFTELKSALLAFIHASDQDSIKNTAEQLLNRLASQQLLSHENGPLQNVVLQIPLPLNENHTDLTVQWNGKRKEDGSIDPNYCRIIFYLELSSLNETSIDMQVQNRIVKITVYNEHNELVKELAQKWIPMLKENFTKINYTLSSIAYSGAVSSEPMNPISARLNNPISSYSGVDLRI